MPQSTKQSVAKPTTSTGSNDRPAKKINEPTGNKPQSVATKKQVLPLNFGRNAFKATEKTTKEEAPKRKRNGAADDVAKGKNTVTKRRKQNSKTVQAKKSPSKPEPAKKKAKSTKDLKIGATVVQPSNGAEKEDGMEAAAESRPITSYAIVTADTARNRCAGCSKGIPVGALCFSKLERAGRHVKKKDATSTFWHQNCFIMPATLVKFPVECLRGWTQLAEKQQRRVRALFAAGEGATMRKVTEDMEKAKAAATATSNNDKNNNTNGNNTERSKKSNNTASTTAVANNTSLVASHANTQHNDKQHMRFD